MGTRLRNGALGVVAVVALGSSAADAGWQDRATPNDVKRLSLLDEARSKGLNEAGGRGAEIARAVLDAAPMSASAGELAGRWRCRTIKLGGMAPAVVYSWFSCRIGDRGGELSFEKAGTQRLSGTLYPHESGGYVLLGSYSARGERRHIYSGNGQAVGAQATPDDAVGLLVATGRSSARIEFPYPLQESVFDVIELKR